MAGQQFSLKALQTLVERIKRMAAPDAVLADDMLTEAMREYEEIVERTNLRLQECDELLRDGHRNQALQKCEVEPDLFRVIELLEFPQRQLWEALVVDAGYAAPPVPLMDVVGELNEAYNLEKPLADLMRLHRLHALAGSPLRTRLDFLRKIAQKDPATVIWREDVRTYERARLQQVEEELAKAERLRDASLAAQLEREVRPGEWTIPLPPNLVENAVRVHTELRRASAKERLKKLAVELHETYGAKEFSRARQLRTAWNGQAAIAQLAPTDSLLEEVEPAFNWLDREEEKIRVAQEHKAAVAALEQALDAGLGRIDLERCYNQVERTGGVSLELSNKTGERIKALEVWHKRRLAMTAFFSLVFIGCAAAGVYWYIGVRTRAAEFARQVEGLRQLVEEQKVPAADEYLTDLQAKAPANYESPEIQKLAADLQILKDKEQDRLVARERTLAAIQAALEDNGWNRLELALLDVDQAAKLCLGDVEQREVQDLEGQVRAAIRKHQDAKDQEFVTELRAISDAVTAASPSNIALIAQLKSRALSLQKMVRVSTELTRQAEPLVIKLDSMATTDAARRQELAALDKIDQVVGQTGPYVQALQDYAKQFPGSARSAIFTKLAQDEAPLWNGVEKWNALLANWSEIDFRRVSPARAKELLAEADGVLQTFGDFPAAPAIKELQPYLEAVTKRVDDAGERSHKAMYARLDDRRVSAVDMMITTEGKRYYFEKQPIESTTKDDELVFKVYKDGSLNEVKRMSLPLLKIATPKNVEGVHQWTSPQRRVRDQTILLLDTLTDDNWEPTFNKLLMLLDNEPQMDPLLTLQLTQIFLETGCQGSFCLQKGFKPNLDLLASVTVSIESNWFDPEDTEAVRSRKSAEETLRRLTNRETCVKASADLYSKLQKASRGTRYSVGGWLQRDLQGAWVASLPRLSPQAAGELFVIMRGEGGAVQARKVGSCNAGQAMLDDQAADLRVEGRLLYVVNTN